MSWQPLLDGAERERALDVVRDIARDLDREEAPHGGLAGGAVGIALMYAYAEQAGLGGGARADELLGKAVDLVAEQPMGSSLYSGFSGIAWAADHMVAAASSVGGDDTDANEDIDAALVEHLEQTPWQLDYDLIVGLAGFGVYALERIDRPGRRRVLELTVDRLAELLRPVPPDPGATWWTSPALMIPETAANNPQGNYNTGLAHGSPGPIVILGAAAHAGVAAAKARKALDDSVTWLLAQRAERPKGAIFPYAVNVPPDPAPSPVRAAWCYGDPGVSIALLSAARAVGDTAWEQAALEVARRVARRPVEDSGVIDAGLCHGAAGLAHIYGRLWHATHEPVFKEAARLWTDQLLGMRKEGGIGGYLAWVPGQDMKLGWDRDAGLLTGSAGIALALLGLATEHEPRWDRMLLTNVAPL
jgi:class I lanthipeptide synthase